MLQRDPAGYAPGPNLYGYGLSRPVDLADPAGLTPFGPTTHADVAADVDVTLAQMGHSDDTDSGSHSGRLDLGLSVMQPSSLGVGFDWYFRQKWRSGVSLESRFGASGLFSPSNRLQYSWSGYGQLSVPLGGGWSAVGQVGANSAVGVDSVTAGFVLTY